MALGPQERKKRLGHGGLAKVVRMTRRAPSHVTYVNQGVRRDAVVERAIARLLKLSVEEAGFPASEDANGSAGGATLETPALAS